MLHSETVSDSTLALLKRLLSLKGMESFNLVGDTALSLQYGHRISVDLDLFTTNDFDNEKTLEILKSEFGDALQYEGGTPKFGIFCYINDVKIDIIKYLHPIVFDILEIDEVRMYSPKDISAMKIQAIFGRGKKKDFWDIAELLKTFSIADIISFHKKNILLIKSLFRSHKPSHILAMPRKVKTR